MSIQNVVQEELLTISELAQVLKVKKSWLYAQTRQTGPETIPCVRIGKYLRFYLPPVMEWIGRKQASRCFRAT
jgi:predicted DNA-binding transcriptional regulator AlpA